MDKNKLSYSEIESFILNNPVLREVESHISEFNPIKVMRMEGMEIRHSRILGWLLDPYENHGLHDDFTRKFLSEALRGSKIRGIRSLDISAESFQSANVYIEWNNIDIFIEHPDKKWAFIIENKVYSKQSKNQLTRYRLKIEERFPEHKVVGIFLTLDEELSNDDFYAQICYEQLVSLLGDTIYQAEDALSLNILNFINDYIDIVSELTGMNKKQNKMEQLARSVYQGNKKVLDFIFEHGKKDEFEFATEKFIAGNSNIEKYQKFSVGNQDFIFLYSSKNWYRFIPLSWVEILGEVSPQNWSSDEFKWKGCENWFPYPIVCWFKLVNENTVALVVEVGCLEDFEIRQKLISFIKKAYPKAKFSVKAYSKGTKYSRFINLQRKLESIQDEESIRTELSTLISKSFNEPSKAIEAGLIEFMANID